MSMAQEVESEARIGLCKNAKNALEGYAKLCFDGHVNNVAYPCALEAEGLASRELSSAPRFRGLHGEGMRSKLA
jgi:hypothetical protein